MQVKSSVPLSLGGAGGFKAANELEKNVLAWQVDKGLLEKDLRDKCKIEARIMDLYRNNDMMRGLVEKQVDALVGPRAALQLNPDYEALGVDQAEAMEWGRKTERVFHAYGDSPENWFSANRSMDLTQTARQAARSLILTGEIFCSREWLRSPIGFDGDGGRRFFNTSFNVFSPNRVKTPSRFGNGRRRIFEGLEFNAIGEATHYHIDQADLRQTRTFGDKVSKRVSKYTRFGWHQLFHIYEPFLPEYPRGISRLAAILMKSKALDTYCDYDLQKHIIAANYALAVTSNATPEQLAEMFAGVPEQKSDLQLGGGLSEQIPADVLAEKDRYLKEIIEGRFKEMTGGDTLHLFEGEDIKILQPPVASQTSGDYKRDQQRDIANGAGMSYELGAGDFRQLSFSAGQLSLGIYEHGANIQRRLYVHKFLKLCFRSWLDEAIDKGIVPLLGDMPYFPNKEHYARCEFTGAKRIHVDPVKAANANRINLANGTTSRIDIANENGIDLEAVVNNRGHEAVMVLKNAEAAAERCGLSMSEEQKIGFLLDYLAKESVDVVEAAPESPQGD